MMLENQLLPEKYPQNELLICDVANMVLKDLMPQMEHPFYSLSKKPDTTIRRYEHGNDWIEIVPSVKGAATIYDKDILIYAISQIMAKLNQGEKVEKRVRINTHEFLMFTNRGTSGREYIALQNSLDRLEGTRIRTNLETDGKIQWEAFGLVDSATTRRSSGLDGRLIWCEINLSDWVFNAIKSNDVLTLHRDYFKLRKPIERRIYELARKHCGQQKEWPITLKLLHKKSGSKSSLKEFRRLIKTTVEINHLPDYTIEYEKPNDRVTFNNREEWWKDNPKNQNSLLYLPPSAYEEARKFAPHYDVYYLEQEFHNWWVNSGRPAPKNIKAAFIGFCKKIHKRKPYP